MQTPAARRWSAILARAEQSELSMREFAREHGLNPNTMAWWKWRLGQQSQEPAFLEVVVVESTPLRVCIGSAFVEVDRDTDLDLLRRVVEALA